METYKIYAAGSFTDTADYYELKASYDNKAFALVGRASAEDLNRCIDLAVGVEAELAGMPLYERSQILTRIADDMAGQRSRLATLLCLEAGKPMKYSIGEVDRAIQTFRIAAAETLRQPGEYLRLDWTPSGKGKEGWVRYFPLGAMAGISPFNFPLNLSVHKIAPAIAAGNPIILKPASQTPVTMLELAGIIDKTTLPKGALSVLPMDRVTGNQLVTDPRLKMLSFTGSPEVGWRMKQTAGTKRVVLELGGNAGVIVDESADLNLALQKCLIGGFAYSGQVCIHTQRIYVLSSVFSSFSSAYAEMVQQLKYGDPLDPATDISVMIDDGQASRVESWINEAIESGARVLCGGMRKGRYVEPTVLTSTRPAMKVCTEEVFGPVVIIEPVASFEDGIAMINDSQYGLQAGIFTRRTDHVSMAFEKLKVGGVIVNDVPTFRVDHMPYGGVKNSGIGREGVRYAMMEMMEPRLLVKEF